VDHNAFVFWTRLPVQISLTEAKAHLTDLVRRAEAGEEVVLTRHGTEVAKIVAKRPPSPKGRLDRDRIDEITRRAVAKLAAQGHPVWDDDDMYDENGLPK
jgi:prevent-host-death family protein